MGPNKKRRSGRSIRYADSKIQVGKAVLGMITEGKLVDKIRETITEKMRLLLNNTTFHSFTNKTLQII